MSSEDDSNLRNFPSINFDPESTIQNALNEHRGHIVEAVMILFVDNDHREHIYISTGNKAVLALASVHLQELAAKSINGTL